MEGNDSVLKMKVLANGPIIVDGKFEITLANGTKEVRDKAAICRCGASKNKPYCDGSHLRIEFEG